MICKWHKKNFCDIFQSEEQKTVLEGRLRDAELLAARCMRDSEQKSLDAQQLHSELLRARHSEKEAKEKLLSLLAPPVSRPIVYNFANQ